MRVEGASPRGLVRILGVGFGLAVIVGSTLGVGILRTPGLVAGQIASPSAILAVWFVGGLYTLLGAVCLTELGTMLPEAGGYYVYARRAFGDGTGFVVGWSDWITYCSVLGYVSIAIGEFSAVLFPALDPAIKWIAVGVLVFFVVLQRGGVRVSGRFQEVTTAVKFLAFLALVSACLAHAASSHGSVAEAPPVAATTLSLRGVVVALQSVAITFGGWQSALYFTEEDKDPRRNLPRAMIGGVLSVLVVYMLVNAALLAVLPVGAIAGSPLPAAEAANAIFGPRGRTFITVLSLLSLPPLVNAILMIGTRVLFAMGRDGLFWKGAAVVHEGGTPVRATLATAAVAASLIATGTFQKLVGVASFFLAVNYCVSCLAVIVLRRREPLLPRPFRAWGYPWSVGIVLVGALAFLIGILLGDPPTGLLGAGLLAAGLLGRAGFLRRPSAAEAEDV